MRVRRYVGAPPADLLDDAERAEYKRRLKAKFPRARHVKVIASSDGPICEITFPNEDGTASTYVGRVEKVLDA